MKSIIGILLLTLVGLYACNEDKEKDVTPFSGIIEISNLENGTIITGGSDFQITGSITGNKEMHGFVLTVYNNNDQSVVYTSNNHDHASSYTINETIIHNLSAATPLKLVIEVEVDHDGEHLKKELLFDYQP